MMQHSGGARTEFYFSDGRFETKDIDTTDLRIFYHLDKLDPRAIIGMTHDMLPFTDWFSAEEVTDAAPRPSPRRISEIVKKKEKREKRKSNKPVDEMEIGMPYNLHHAVHVDFDLQWSATNVHEVFSIEGKLGNVLLSNLFIWCKMFMLMLINPILSQNGHEFSSIGNLLECEMNKWTFCCL